MRRNDRRTPRVETYRYGFGIHSFNYDDMLQPEPAIKNVTTYDTLPHATYDDVVFFNASLVSAVNEKIYLTNCTSEIATYTSDTQLQSLDSGVAYIDDDILYFYDVDSSQGPWQLGNDAPDVSSVATAANYSSGEMDAGDYYYRLLVVDDYNNVSQASDAIGPVTLTSTGSVDLTNIPALSGKESHYELYRTESGAVSAGNNYYRADNDLTSTSFQDTLQDRELTVRLEFAGEDYARPSTWKTRPTGSLFKRVGERLFSADGNEISFTNMEDGEHRYGEVFDVRTLGDSDPIRAFGTAGNRLFIFKRDELYEMETSYPNRFQKVASVGTLSPDTVCESGDVLYFYYGGEIYRLPDFTMISKEINIPKHPTTGKKFISNMFVDHTSRLWVIHPDSPSDYGCNYGGNDLFYTASVYDPKTNKWARIVDTPFTHGVRLVSNYQTLVMTRDGYVMEIDWDSTGRNVSSARKVYKELAVGDIAGSQITLDANYQGRIGDSVWIVESGTPVLYHILSFTNNVITVDGAPSVGTLLIGYSFFRWDFLMKGLIQEFKIPVEATNLYYSLQDGTTVSLKTFSSNERDDTHWEEWLVEHLHSRGDRIYIYFCGFTADEVTLGIPQFGGKIK